jgi:hypothetical protein
MTNRSGQPLHARLRALFLPLTLAACFGAASCVEAQVIDPQLPAGAIASGDGVYMVPIAPDDTGCMQYRMHAPGKAVVQVIFYRAADGTFTPDRSRADCKKP